MSSNSWWRTARKFSWACRARAEARLFSSPHIHFTLSQLHPHASITPALGVILKHDLLFHQSHLLLFKTLFHPSIFVQVPLLPNPSAPLRSYFPTRFTISAARSTQIPCPAFSFFLHARLFLKYSADSKPVDLLAPGFN